MKILGVIPARYQSSRFPGKPLATIGGTSMIQRVYEQAKQAECLLDVIVATDDKRILEHVESFGGKAIMTSIEHESGTDRVWEAVEQYGAEVDYVINIQGDEPFIQPKQIDLLGNMLNGKTEIATLAIDIEETEELFNSNVVKVVRGLDWQALYFSRSPIPYLRGVPEKEWVDNHSYQKHIGLYGYRKDVLEELTNLMPSILEYAESLEQLRWLQNGYSILVGLTLMESVGIDTPEDLAKAEELLKRQSE